MRARLPKCNVPLFHEFPVELLTYTDWAKKRQGDTECDRRDSADFVTTEDPRTEIALRHSGEVRLPQSPADAMGAAAACFRQVAKPSRARPKMVRRFW